MKKLNIKSRFAPSPTGFMHFGNLRTALFNFLFARHNNGKFLLRIEDTDIERSKQEYLDSLLSDLEWLDIDYDEGPVKQSDRIDIYNEHFERLIKEGKAYHCFCSEEQLKLSRKAQLASGKPPRYEGTCYSLSQEEIQKKLDDGLKPALRFRVERQQLIEFDDLIKGRQRFKSNDLGDFIIRRQNGTGSFMFCNAIDDSLMEVTHALRGEDHLTNSPRQILILKAFGYREPTYGHFPMINAMDGSPLSKRNGSKSILELKEEGYHQDAILNCLSRMGHYYKDNKLLSLRELGEKFDFKNISTGPSKYDESHLKHWQKEAIMHMDQDSFKLLIDKHLYLVPSDKRQDFAKAIKSNVLMPNDALKWAKDLYTDEDYNYNIKEVIKKAGLNFFEKAIELYDDKMPFKDFLNNLKNETNLKGKDLFMPIRAAISHNIDGPELAQIVDLLGSEMIMARLEKARNANIQ